MYRVEPDKLKSLRIYIGQNSGELQKLISSSDFKKYYGEIRGEKNKRLSSDLLEFAEIEPLVYNKNFYFFAELPPETALQKNVVEKITEIFGHSRALREFLSEGVQD